MHTHLQEQSGSSLGAYEGGQTSVRNGVGDVCMLRQARSRAHRKVHERVGRYDSSIPWLFKVVEFLDVVGTCCEGFFIYEC